MKTLYIVGGDGFARECYIHLQNAIGIHTEFLFGGFLGHGGYGKTVDYKTYQQLYIGEVSKHSFSDDEYAIIGAAYPPLRVKIYNELKARRIKFFNLITKDCLIADIANIGEANIIISSSLTADVNLGVGNVLNGNIILGHDVEIGDFNFFGPRSQFLGNVKVGDYNQIGANAIVLPRAKIGNNNKIAPLSAVYKGCRDNCYMAGNPALKLGNV